MDWERMRSKLETVLNLPVKLLKLPAEEWVLFANHQRVDMKKGQSLLRQGHTCFVLEIQSGAALLMDLGEVQLTALEKNLVELALDTNRLPEKMKTHAASSDEEKTAHLIQDWIQRQLANNVRNATLPDKLVSLLSLNSTQIPLLLYGDYSDTQHVSYKDLKKLLETFFATDVILIPMLEKEWLILVPEKLLTASESEDMESAEEALSSVCSGLYEMLANEWIGECHLTIDYPLAKPALSLLDTITGMLETMKLGQLFYPEMNIHLPWKIHLEKLLSDLSHMEQVGFVKQVFKGSEPLNDSEIVATLEYFFEHDCNVSETAKKLYIHRNTLLYRLDKFSQETGLDVRRFKDAVLVKIAMLLYKVTKRM